MRVLSIKGMRELHLPIAFGKVLAMQAPHRLQMGFQPLGQARRQHRASILAALAIAHRDLQTLQIKIMHPQA
jgi:hypothetical protein